MFRKVLSYFVIVLSFFSIAQAQTKHLYYVNPFTNAAATGDYGFTAIDPDTGIENTTDIPARVFPQVNGLNVTGANSITTHPITGEMWAILKLNTQSGRELVKINPVTFAITDIGNTGKNISSIAFNADASILYAVTGDGASGGTGPGETLFTLNQTTAAATQVCTLGNGADGEVIAFNPVDSKLYHWSGGATVFERIEDTTGPACTVTNIPITLTGGSTAYLKEVFGAVYDPSIQKFYMTDINSDLLTVDSDGTDVTVIRKTTFGYLDAMNPGADDARGIALRTVAQPDIRITGTPASGGSGVSIASGDLTPSENDGTARFVGSAGQTSFNFLLDNIGTAPLKLYGNPKITITGDPEFSVDFTGNTDGIVETINAGPQRNVSIIFNPSGVGTKTATVSIQSNDLDETPFTFALSATPSLDTDGDNQPDVYDDDDDNDNITDVDEVAYGTDPLRSDSLPLNLGSTVCSEWNGFLSFLTQILELRNISSSTIALTTTLYNQAGVAQGSVNYNLQARQQLDLIINDFAGFAENTYGNVCTTINTPNSDGAIDGNYVYYLLGAPLPSFDIGYSEPFDSHSTQSQFLTYNNYNPSLDPSDATDFVASFVQISNDENSTITGNLIFYSQLGSILRNVPVTLNAKQRVDIDAHTLGTNLTGLVEWRPSSKANDGQRVKINRYYFSGSSPVLDDLVTATSLPAKIGSGIQRSGTFKVDSRYAVLEISNTLSTVANIQVLAFSDLGAPVTPINLTLPAKGTIHFVLDDLLSSGTGNIKVQATQSGSIIAQLIEYGLTNTNSLKFVSNFAVRQAVGSTLLGSYNNFLGTCELRLSNETSADQTVNVSMKRYDNSTVLSPTAFIVPANGAKLIDICSRDVAQSYGVVTVESATAGVVVGEIVRTSNGTGKEFGTPLRPYFISSN